MKLFAAIAAACLCASALGQGVRYDNRVVTVARNNPPGVQVPMLAVPNAQVTICADGNCASKATIYSNQALSTQTANPIRTDGQGNFGFWIAAGQYFYKVVQPSGTVTGIFPLTIGGTGGSGGEVSSVFGRTGNITGQNGDYSFSLISGTISAAQLPIFSSSAAGAVSASGGGTANFLRADGTWAAPGGAGGGCTTPTGLTGIVPASNGSGGCQTTVIGDNGTIVSINGEPLTISTGTPGHLTLTGSTSQNGMVFDAVNGAHPFFVFTGNTGTAGLGIFDTSSSALDLLIGNSGALITPSGVLPSIDPAATVNNVICVKSLGPPLVIGVCSGLGGGVFGTPASVTLTNASGYPNATSSTFGVVKPDNSTITISGGVLTAVGGGSTPWATPGTIGSTTPNTGAFTTLTATSIGTGATPPTACGSAAGCVALAEAATAGTPTAGQDYFRADSTAHQYKMSLNNGAEFVSLMNFSSIALGSQVTGTLAAAQFPALTGDVTTTAGALATTIAANAVTGAKMANNTVTATQLAAQYSKGSCTEVWGGSGTSFALTSGDDAISNNTCYNDSGVTRTITAVKCRSSAASNTTTVNPTFGAAGTGTTILSGALTCGSSLAYSSTGTVTNPNWTIGTGITPAMGGTLTGTSIAMIVEFSF